MRTGSFSGIVRAFGLSLACTGALLAGGCGGARGPGGGAGAESLVEPLEDIQMSTNGGVAGYLQYMGGPNETWAVTARGGDQSWPGEINMALREKRLERDDPPPLKVEPTGGAQRVVAAVPTYCGKYTGQVRGTDPVSAFDGWQLLESDAPWHPIAVLTQVRKIGWLACDRRLYGPRQRNIAALLQDVVNKTKLPLETVLSWMPELVGMEKDFDVETIARKAEDANVSRLLQVQRPDVPGQDDPETVDLFDLSGHYSQLARAGLLQGCKDKAFCAFERKGFKTDEARLEAQLITDPLLRAAALMKLTLFADKMKEKLGDEPPETADIEKGYKEWMAQVMEPNKELVKASFEQLYALRYSEDTAKEKCDAALAPHRKAFLEARAPKTFNDVEAAATSPVGLVLWYALAKCHIAQKSRLFIPEVVTINLAVNRHLGPRTATRRLDWLRVPEGSYIERRDDTSESREIKSVAVEGDKVLVTFPPERWNNEVENCYETSKIDGIRSDGTLIYRTNCYNQATAPTFWDIHPILLSKEEGSLLKAGQWIRFIATGKPLASAKEQGKVVLEEKAQKRPANLLLVWPSKKAAESGAMTWAYGATLNPKK